MNFRFTIPTKIKSSGYGDVLTNRPKIESIDFLSQRADYDDFAYVKMRVGEAEICFTKTDIKKLINALEGVLK